MTPDMEAAGRATHTNGFADVAKTTNTTGNPYETNPDNIPRDDPFLAKSANYGRYTPHPDDFTPRYKDWYHSDPDANAFWVGVAEKFCTPENSLNIKGPREGFAAGSVIIWVDRESADGAAAEWFSCVNANELSAARKVEEALREIGVAVPVTYFCGTIEGRNVTIESRIPGVSLEVAERYLTTKQINIFKAQTRQIIHVLACVDPSPQEPTYVCRGLNSQNPPPGQEKERAILFAERTENEDLCFIHNDLVPAQIIVKDDRVVGVTGWRQSGYFGLERAKQVHRSSRNTDFPKQTSGKSATWLDLYTHTYVPSRRPPPLVANKDTPLPSVKTEPVGDDFETKSFGSDLPSEWPTSKALANLRNGGASRASSSDRTSPANSVKPSNKKPASKKKPAPKRRANDLDAESLDERRSNTPASRTSKTPGRKQDSVSIAGSPAPEEKRKTKKRPRRLADDDDEESDENALFCICRRPDNHTWMIGCDGGCEDWFHGKCVDIDARDSELIDKYICPNCSQNGKGCTTWKPMCRLLECRKPARVARKSKYCSDEHGHEFMRRQVCNLKLAPERKGQEDLGSMGGILTPGDLRAAILGVSSVAEFRKLGDKILSHSPESISDDIPNGDMEVESTENKQNLDIESHNVEYSADEAAKVEKIRKRRDDLLHRKEMLAARASFVNLLRQRSKGLVERLKKLEPKSGWKDICGFDMRLAWSDEEFDDWRLSEAGKLALKEGTAEAMASSYPDNDEPMGGTDEDEISFLTRGVCTKKRCERHKQWVKVQQQDILFEEETVKRDLAKAAMDARTVAESAVLRKWAQTENVPATIK
ncbi:hypothetical protein N7520_008035 [Penicillium odoratum]|uniref:uncharacterized protein n=1 Tax=Penicillium odoratum TaxID=1167516 RepID=UPI0025497D60|nr:uncharacterized protein N7520_008035 [Penicillium odoratum]KAJ5760879.1 hypothetical protein N7520_008035 [Penicillium odoratum]